MIEDKADGIKISVNPIETLWSRVKLQSENEIKVLKDSLTVQEAVLILAESKLKELSNA
jgi:hypothetical protein